MTPGGITIDAIHEMLRKEFKAIVIDAVGQAYEKYSLLTKVLRLRAATSVRNIL
ncbi:MAG: hypothetical protein DRJ51_06995 [Thermoprotei archaeon]|nr:MAG: hypothetical protein DRJ51_06995 [Thermoprotei archaeon]RLF02220.1 MAG: hypothetical protein DRJ59_04180 [Thermoprotei archaeon]